MTQNRRDDTACNVMIRYEGQGLGAAGGGRRETLATPAASPPSEQHCLEALSADDADPVAQVCAPACVVDLEVF